MKFNLLETVVLTRNIEKSKLKKGDLGTIVEFYGKHDYEIEFVTAGGNTQAIITLNEKDIRPVESKDMISVRALQEVA